MISRTSTPRAFASLPTVTGFTSTPLTMRVIVCGELEALTPHTIQSYYNGLTKEGLAPKTVKKIHGILHKALQQAVSNSYIRTNPADSCILPRPVRKELKPLDEDMITAFLKAVQGHQFGELFTITLFTGMRERGSPGPAVGLRRPRQRHDHH